MIETIKPILTEADHTATLAEIDRLIALNAHEGSPDLSSRSLGTRGRIVDGVFPS